MIETLRHIFAEFKPPILFAYVFGSTAAEMHNSQSDLDIAVYMNFEDASYELSSMLSLYTEISRALKRNDIDVVILNTCVNQMLLYEIMTKAKLIYDAAPEARAIFEQKTLHAAIDFKEQRERLFA